jgi:hypothetical protein
MKGLPEKQCTELLETLAARFEKNMHRHKGVSWKKVQARLAAHPDKLWSLYEMERTGGEPDVVGNPGKDGSVRFVDCSPESPSGRRSLCYDREALDLRKEHKPKSSVMDVAAGMGVEVLSEEQYRELQEFGEFDLKTSSWVRSPESIRKRGGALFGDRRYGRVFIYHNGAQSYYSSRAFRALLNV